MGSFVFPWRSERNPATKLNPNFNDPTPDKGYIVCKRVEIKIGGLPFLRPFDGPSPMAIDSTRRVAT